MAVSPAQISPRMQFPPPAILLDEGSNIMANSTAFASKGPRASSSMTLTDPIATHLLVETALGDSKAFDVLPIEELDALKKEDAMLAARVETTRRKLALETKVHDAATSLNRLYGSKRGSTGSTTAGARRRPSYAKTETVERAESELAESVKKCDELGRELYFLEQRSRQTQTRLLRHTAAILQITYGNGHRPQVNGADLPGGRPYNPDSLGHPDTDWDKMNDFKFGDRSVPSSEGRDFDGYIDEFDIDGPSKRVSTTTLKIREEQLVIGKRLAELSSFVGDILSQVNAENSFASSDPPTMKEDSQQIDFLIFENLQYIERGLDELKEERIVQRLNMDSNAKSQQNGDGRGYDDTEARLLRLLLELNNRFVQILHLSNSKESASQVPSIREGVASQLKFAQAMLSRISIALKHMTEAAYRGSGRTLSKSEKLAQYDMVIGELWQIVLSTEEDAQKKKQQQHTQRQVGGFEFEDDTSIDDDDDLSSDFSLPIFLTKMQWLVAKASYLKGKHGDMSHRIRKLQDSTSKRNANDSNAVRDLQARLEREGQEHEKTRTDFTELQAQFNSITKDRAAATTELDRAGEEHAKTKANLIDIQAQFNRIKQEHATTKARLDRETQDHDSTKDDLATLQTQLNQSQSRLADLSQSDTQLSKLRTDHDRLQSDHAELQHSLSTLTSARDTADAATSDAQVAHAHLEAEIVRLNTELTIAKAETDAAYGSRSERARAAAQAADSEAAVREAELRKELAATLAEFEELARASVEAEREREESEREVDRLRERIGELEAQVGEARIARMGLVKGESGEAGSSTGMGLMRGEFKKMMRDMRVDHQKALKAEQEDKRKLEAQIRALKSGKDPAIQKSLPSSRTMKP